MRKAFNAFEEKIGVLREFRVYTFVVLLIIGISIVSYLGNYIKADVLERLSESAVFVTQTSVSPHLTSDDFKWPRSEDTVQRLDKFIKDGIVDSSKRRDEPDHFQNIVAFKVWNRKGRVIYDSSGKTTGEVHANNDELKVALNRKRSAGFTKANSEDRFISEEKGDLIELYIPAMIRDRKSPAGAYELYLSTRAISQFTNKTIITIIIIMFLGLIFLYFTLSWFFSRAHYKISEKNDELHKLTNKIIGSLKELEDNYLGTIQALTMAVDAKDHYTAGHSFRVASLAKEIGRILGLSEEALLNLERGARFHDIGKIGITDTILNKHARLNEEEYKEVKQHTVIGAKILGSVKFLKDIVPIVRSHHERLDGSGYPDGSRAVNIPLAARIVAVADVFDAMTSDRPNRKAFSTKKAFEELMQGSGQRYDKEVVLALMEAYSGAALFDENQDDELQISELKNAAIDIKSTKKSA